MKKSYILLMCLLAILAARTSLKAQEITITLSPGWNWISYPNAVTMEINEALGSFAPVQGDLLKAKNGSSATFNGTSWRGGLTHFTPGFGYMYYSARSEATSFVFANASSTVVETATPTDITTTSAVVGGTVTVPEGGHVFLQGVCWGTEPNPDIDGDHTAEGTGMGSFSSTLEGLIPNTTYYIRAYAVSDHGLVYGNEQSFTVHAYVDLGLPSGLLWATCNVGANTPEEYGDYFAWGETQPKDTYNWSTYQYCMGSKNTLTKYCNNSSNGYNGFTDNLTTLLPEDDAAMANWGNGWRMPTEEEWEELYNNTTNRWTTQNGVNGRLFTASNGNSLFLPAAGNRDDSSLDDAGYHGCYWSSSLYAGGPSGAWYFYWYGSGIFSMNNLDRYYGRSVRAVRVGSQNTSFSIDATATPSEGGTVTGTGNYAEGSTCTLIATANEGYTFTNWTENGEVVSTDATYTFTVTGDRSLVANFTANSGGNHAYVDLGLPSGLLWATCNVGADTPEGYGDYFAWGETQPKDYYDWSTYQYCNGNYNALTKYCNISSYGYNGFIYNLTTLMPEDDAATVNWGSDWRMPTKEECQELYNNTTQTWTAQNGVYGRLFTATNGNSIFLPAAGYRGGSSHYDVGSYGNDWSSSLLTSYPVGAWEINFSIGDRGTFYDGRHLGFTVRPVRGASQNTSYIIEADANPFVGGEVSGGGTYQTGTECTLTATASEGYSFANWAENSSVVSTNATYTFTVNADRTLVAHFTYNGGGGNAPTGAIDGLFTINANGDQVYFSQGNLQYQASTNTWRFAENQWDYVGTQTPDFNGYFGGTAPGSDNANISENYGGWIDLFGWGTSGYNHGAVCYHPWSTSQAYSDYYAYGQSTYNLYDQTGQADWGYNAISNGGNTTNTWRTLTGGGNGEWEYIFASRSTPSGIRYAKARVNGVNT